MLREVVDREFVGACRCALLSAARIAFQACSFNHSDISPYKWNHSLPEGGDPLNRRLRRDCRSPEIAAKHETIILVDGNDMVRGELVHDPEHGWIGKVDWSTQDLWESCPPAVAARG